MLIPIRTDVRTRQPPLGNWLLVGLNALAFFVFDMLLAKHPFAQEIKREFVLNAATPSLGQYITYQFLHGDPWHLLGNMLFLWIFGNAVCDRMGNIPYVLFYLAGGVFAGMVFANQSDNPMLGASGAIAAVTTAFLVLFPRVHITMLFWMVIVTTFEVPAMLLIVIKIILWDNILAPNLDPSGINQQIAFSAHLGGYAFGFIIPMLFLLVGALPRNQFDLLAVWKRWSQRSNWSTEPDFGRRVLNRPARVGGSAGPPFEPELTTGIERHREDVVDRLAEHDLAEAARLYLRLTEMQPGVVLPRAQQLEIANYFAQHQFHAQAARAYEAYVAAYPTSPDSGRVRLMLGLIYNRYLHEYERAALHLREALERTTDNQQRQLALDELRDALSRGGTAGQ